MLDTTGGFRRSKGLAARTMQLLETKVRVRGWHGDRTVRGIVAGIASCFIDASIAVRFDAVRDVGTESLRQGSTFVFAQSYALDTVNGFLRIELLDSVGEVPTAWRRRRRRRCTAGKEMGMERLDPNGTRRTNRIKKEEHELTPGR